jgi:hypothetical protein
MAQSKHAYINYITDEIKTYPSYFPVDNSLSFCDSDVIIDLEHHLALNSPDSDTNANTNTCITAHKCTICLGVPRIPVLLSNCGHIFCDFCIKNLADTNGDCFFNCPTCRTEGDIDEDLLNYDAWPCLMQEVWAIMKMKCMFCGNFQGSASEVDRHERWSCEKRTISCERACCHFVGTIEEAVEHVLICEHTLVCCIGCNYITNLSSIEKHNCERVKKRISMMNPEVQGRIKKGRPGELGIIFTWAVEMQLAMEELAQTGIFGN